MVPGVGLFLNELYFEGYNFKIQRENEKELQLRAKKKIATTDVQDEEQDKVNNKRERSENQEAEAKPAKKIALARQLQSHQITDSTQVVQTAPAFVPVMKTMADTNSSKIESSATSNTDFDPSAGGSDELVCLSRPSRLFNPDCSPSSNPKRTECIITKDGR